MLDTNLNRFDSIKEIGTEITGVHQIDRTKPVDYVPRRLLLYPDLYLQCLIHLLKSRLNLASYKRLLPRGHKDSPAVTDVWPSTSAFDGFLSALSPLQELSKEIERIDNENKSMQIRMRHLNGEDVTSLHLPELASLEATLETGLSRVRNWKDQELEDENKCLSYRLREQEMEMAVVAMDSDASEIWNMISQGAYV